MLVQRPPCERIISYIITIVDCLQDRVCHSLLRDNLYNINERWGKPTGAARSASFVVDRFAPDSWLFCRGTRG